MWVAAPARPKARTNGEWLWRSQKAESDKDDTAGPEHVKIHKIHHGSL